MVRASSVPGRLVLAGALLLGASRMAFPEAPRAFVGPIENVPGPVSMMGRDWRALRLGGAWTLEHLGPRAASAVPDLVARLGDHAREVRRQAADALVQMGGPAAADETAKALASKRSVVRRLAAQTLGRMGSGARSALGPLRAALTDERLPVRLAAFEAIRRIEAAGPDSP